MQLLDGKILSTQIKKEIKSTVDTMVANGARPPHLAAILVGNHPASETYVASKIKNCAEVGFQSSLFRFSDTITQDELLQKINELNNNPSIDGFIVQLPLPKHIHVHTITLAIDPAKDVDGFHPLNQGNMLLNQPCLLPATPYGILMILEKYNIKTDGKHCVVIGRSNIVGLPMSILMVSNTVFGNSTVTMCHSHTDGLNTIAAQADILIAAIGKPNFVTPDMVKPGAVVIDVGINAIPSTKTKSGFQLVGDVAFHAVAPKCSYITPVPGGVGLMTIIGLLKNTLKAAQSNAS
ncbi:MAG: hypothetical protein RIQ89_525 [Bacteroidota bacterium]|jgi:methylenetetrahydrofolate dehydrogenase (NADP+)/methenyltetrahydrofolate cyclohydrolase